MFGAVIGVLSLIGLWKLSHHHGGRWGRRNWMLRRVYQRLDTTPGQEKVIAAAFEKLREKGRAVRDAAEDARRATADATQAVHFDTDAVRAAFAKARAAVDDAETALIESLQSVHEALEPEQRRVAADMLRGRGHGHCGGGRRAHRFSSSPQEI